MLTVKLYEKEVKVYSATVGSIICFELSYSVSFKTCIKALMNLHCSSVSLPDERIIEDEL